MPCHRRFGPFSGTFGLSLAVAEDEEGMALAFRLRQPAAGGALFSAFAGGWRVRPDGACGCVVSHELRVTMHRPVPAVVAKRIGELFVAQVRGVLGDVQAAAAAATRIDCDSG